MTRTNGSTFRQQMFVIPRWAIGLAVAVYLACGGALLFLFQAHESHPPSLFVQVPFVMFIGFFPALWMLIIGHVNGDARRRGLNRWLWTAVAVLTPNALGIIFYYIYALRRPPQVPCPACGIPARAGTQFCVSCGHQLLPACPGCGGPIEPADAYCASCGRALKG